MSLTIDIGSWILLACGGAFCIVGGIGLLRMPDFFTRLHPAGKNDSLAQVLILIALVMRADSLQLGAKLTLIALFLLFTTPASTHAIARAAWLDGRQPWRRPDPAPEAASRSGEPSSEEARP